MAAVVTAPASVDLDDLRDQQRSRTSNAKPNRPQVPDVERDDLVELVVDQRCLEAIRATGGPVAVERESRGASVAPAAERFGHHEVDRDTSWLLAGGADIQVVKERLGHRHITTTQQYLGTLPDAGDRALDAYRNTRYGTAGDTPPTSGV